MTALVSSWANTLYEAPIEIRLDNDEKDKRSCFYLGDEWRPLDAQTLMFVLSERKLYIQND